MLTISAKTGQCRANLDDFGPNLADTGQLRSNSTQIWPPVQTRPKPSQNRPESCQSRPKVGQILVEFGPQMCEGRPTLMIPRGHAGSRPHSRLPQTNAAARLFLLEVDLGVASKSATEASDLGYSMLWSRISVKKRNCGGHKPSQVGFSRQWH